MSESLEALLARETQEATYESTGTFTISLADAQRKLQQHQLPSLEHHLLKLLQGILQLEPGAIWIESQPKSLAIYWGNAETELDAAHLMTQLEKAVLGSDSPTKDLAIGLLGFLQREPEEIWWCQWLTNRPPQINSLLGSCRQARLRSPLSRFTKTSALVIRSAKSNLQLERSSIAPRVVFAPLAILWNGKLMAPLDWDAPGSGGGPAWLDYYQAQSGRLSRGIALKPSGNCKTWACSGESRAWGHFAPSAGPLAVYHRYLDVERHRRLDLVGRNPNRIAAAETMLRTTLGECIWVMRNSQQPCVLMPIKHGILLDPISVAFLPPGLVVVLACPDLQVDLGQFSPVIDSPSWSDLTVRARGLALRFAQTMLDHPGSVQTFAAEVQPSVLLAFGAGALAGALLLPMPFFLGIPLGGGLLAHAAQRRTGSRQTARLEGTRSRLRSLLRSVEDNR